MLNKESVSVLITALNGKIAPGIINALKNNFDDRPVKVHIANAQDQNVVKHFADSFTKLPYHFQWDWFDNLTNLCSKKEVDVIFSMDYDEMLKMTYIDKTEHFFENNNIKLAMMDSITLSLFANKHEVYGRLFGKIPVPNSYPLGREKDLIECFYSFGVDHLFLKPLWYSNSGSGKHTFAVSKKIGVNEGPFLSFESALHKLRESSLPKLMCTEYLPGKEYSAYIFADKGKMKYCVVLEREDVQNGDAMQSSVIFDIVISNFCERITRSYGLDYCINIQFKENKYGRPHLTEINPRIGGSITLPINAGINMPYLAVKKALGEQIPEDLQVQKTRMTRYYGEVFERI